MKRFLIPFSENWSSQDMHDLGIKGRQNMQECKLDQDHHYTGPRESFQANFQTTEDCSCPCAFPNKRGNKTS